ncbi:hypothetical protein Tco_0460786, partial [Tanacetum coccineum]
QNNDSSEEVKRLQSQLANAKDFTAGDLQNKLALERSKSEEYKDIAEGLRTKFTRFVGSGVECLVRRLLLSSDEFHAALDHVASLGVASGVERGLRMRRTDAEFEAVVQNVSNFL